MTTDAQDGPLNRRRSDDLDWAAILIGSINPKTGKAEGGLVDAVGRLIEFVEFQRRVDSWILRLIGIIVLARFFGADNLWNLGKLLWP